MAYVNTTRAADIGLRNRLNTWVETLSTRYAQYRLYRQTLMELGHLSNRELADLGLHRSQIRSVAAEAAYGK